MKLLTGAKRAVEIKDDILCFPLFEDAKGNEELAQLDKALHHLLLRLVESKDFKGEVGEIYLLNTNELLPAKRLMLVGLGKQKEFTLEKLRKGIGNAVKRAKQSAILNMSFCAANIDLEPYSLGKTITEAAILANYTFDRYKTQEKDRKKPLEQFTLYHGRDDILVKKGMHDAEIVSQATNIARDLINTPAISLTPEILAEQAKELCKESNVKCTIFDEQQMKKIGMHAALAVGSGSAHPPRFIVMEHRGKKKAQTIVLVGKGITFDSGGLGIKLADAMKTMKYDMSGAAAVISVLYIAGKLKLPLHLVGLIAAAENMPGCNAYRPGDGVTALNGKTIEIQHTDAEGRVTLADALSYAARFKPAVVIDIATLTGAASVALGDVCAAIMGNDAQLVETIKQAGERAYERVWELPLYDEYAELHKGAVGDVQNLGGWDGKAGTIVGGMFLKEFVPEGAKWAHLDIAGKAFSDKENSYTVKGATGFGVRLLAEVLQQWNS